MAKENSLYAIADNLQRVIEDGLVWDEETGEIYFDESDMEKLQVAVVDKAEAVVAYSKGRRALAEARKEAAKAMFTSAKALETEANKLDAYAVKCLKKVGGVVETDRMTLKVRKCPASVQIIDPNQIPADYLIPKTTVDISKAAIKKALQDGYEVPGACLCINEKLEVK